MLQPTTQTLEMPLQLLSKKNNKKKNSSNHGKQARSDWPSLVASSNFSSFSKTLKAEPRCPPPYLFTLFLSTHQKHHHMYSLKNTTDPWQHILNNQVHHHQLYCRKKRMKRETKQKMNGVIYYLLTSFTAKKKKKQGHEVHHQPTLL